LAFVLPFLAAWWWLASYDVRFLVTMVPLLAAIAGCMLDEAAGRFGDRLHPGWARRAGWAGALLALALMPLALHKTVDGKRAILRDPLMTDAEKHLVRLGGLYEMALAVNRLPDGSRILGVPSLSLYHIERARFPVLSEAASQEPPWSLAERFDFVIYRFSPGAVPGWAEATTPILETGDGFSLYSTRTSPSD
jgi:hypothetical protein